MNTELAEQVIGHIRMLPRKLWGTQITEDCFDMSRWGLANKCGTAACLAGWTVALAEPQAFQRYLKYFPLPDNQGVAFLARTLLGLTYGQAEAMFHEMDATADDHARAFKAIAENPSIRAEELRKIYQKAL